MNLLNLIELIQRAAPEIGELEAKLLLSQAEQEFAEQTGILTRDDITFTTDGNRYRPLPDVILEIQRVDVENLPVGELKVEPNETDMTTGEAINVP